MSRCVDYSGCLKAPHGSGLHVVEATGGTLRWFYRDGHPASRRDVEAELAPLRPRAVAVAPAPKAAGFTGDACAECGQLQMVRNGSCLLCHACGATTGCS